MSARLKDVQAEVASYMDEILALFKPGGKITVLVRFEGLPDRDFMMTNEADIEDAIACLKRRQTHGISP